MTDDAVVFLPSHRQVAASLSNTELIRQVELGEEGNSPGYLLALLEEWDRRFEPGSAA